VGKNATGVAREIKEQDSKQESQQRNNIPAFTRDKTEY
jgi:hypothetical protein